MKKLGIIIVTHQSEQDIGPLLASLAATIDRQQTEVWIVDNASKDATVAILERENKTLGLPLHLVRSEQNLGFTGGNNLAFVRMQAETPCETIILLNPDTRVHDGWWQPLLAALEENGVGASTSLLLLPDGTVNARGNALHFLGFGFVQDYGGDASQPGASSLFFCSGAIVAFKASVLATMNERLGTSQIFWEELFLYAEDTDLGWRMRMAGLEPRLVPVSRVTHDHRFWQQTLEEKGDRLFLLEKNRYLVMFSNYKVATVAVLLPWIFLSEAALALGLWKLYPHRLRLWRAIWMELRSSRFRARRESLQKGRTTPDSAILRVMTGSIRHGAVPFRPVDLLLDGGLRWSHWLLCAIVWW